MLMHILRRRVTCVVSQPSSNASLPLDHAVQTTDTFQNVKFMRKEKCANKIENEREMERKSNENGQKFEPNVSLRIVNNTYEYT